MRIAFYAPMKPPDDPRPSGDRTVARGLIQALRLAGHEVTLVSRFRSWDKGDQRRQQRLEAMGIRLAERLVRHAAGGDRPPFDLWLTYHLYHKAPDWLGPRVTAAWDIPYVVAEASVAGKQRGGRWRRGYDAAIAALEVADLVLGLNPADRPGVAPWLRPGARYQELAPFLDARPFADAPAQRDAARVWLAGRLSLPLDRPWLLTVGMMRADQKLLSYQTLAAALARVEAPFRLIVVGDGPAEAAVRTAFAPIAETVSWFGAAAPVEMPQLYAAADLYVWPAIKEAFGMAFLEAQAAGLPVVAGASGGVANVVAEGLTGRLVPEGDVAALANAISRLIDDSNLRRTMGAAARRRTCERHDLPVAAADLDRALHAAAESRRQKNLRKAV
ncbi:glycosyltransferase family 4 protein [Jiella sp. M17.18]|uniref:glycosyltransferase family 4 protein n=1 Tax=Jiella sp. M17.18 TaxID=3234247 RepID=UPI0034DDF323